MNGIRVDRVWRCLRAALAFTAVVDSLQSGGARRSDYTCKVNGSQFAWSSATPDAVLTGYGNIVAHHYKGPLWEAAAGSGVNGIVPPAASDSPNPNAIP